MHWNVDLVDKYYEYLRSEIVREDTISLARMAALLTFQGFALSSVGLLMTADWPDEKAICLAAGAAQLRAMLLLLLGGAGLVIAWYAKRGIKASFDSLDVAKNEWESVLRKAKLDMGDDYIEEDPSPEFPVN